MPLAVQQSADTPEVLQRFPSSIQTCIYRQQHVYALSVSAEEPPLPLRVVVVSALPLFCMPFATFPGKHDPVLTNSDEACNLSRKGFDDSLNSLEDPSCRFTHDSLLTYISADLTMAGTNCCTACKQKTAGNVIVMNSSSPSWPDSPRAHVPIMELRQENRDRLLPQQSCKPDRGEGTVRDLRMQPIHELQFRASIQCMQISEQLEAHHTSRDASWTACCRNADELHNPCKQPNDVAAQRSCCCPCNMNDIHCVCKWFC